MNTFLIVLAVIVALIIAFILWAVFSKSPNWYVGKGPADGKHRSRGWS